MWPTSLLERIALPEAQTGAGFSLPRTNGPLRVRPDYGAKRRRIGAKIEVFRLCGGPAAHFGSDAPEKFPTKAVASRLCLRHLFRPSLFEIPE